MARRPPPSRGSQRPSAIAGYFRTSGRSPHLPRCAAPTSIPGSDHAIGSTGCWPSCATRTLIGDLEVETTAGQGRRKIRPADPGRGLAATGSPGRRRDLRAGWRRAGRGGRSTCKPWTPAAVVTPRLLRRLPFEAPATCAIRFPGLDLRTPPPCPDLGEHTREVLLEAWTRSRTSTALAGLLRTGRAADPSPAAARRRRLARKTIDEQHERRCATAQTRSCPFSVLFVDNPSFRLRGKMGLIARPGSAPASRSHFAARARSRPCSTN